MHGEKYPMHGEKHPMHGEKHPMHGEAASDVLVCVICTALFSWIRHAYSTCMPLSAFLFTLYLARVKRINSLKSSIRQNTEGHVEC